MASFSVQALLAISAFVTPSLAFWRLPCSKPVVVERADPIINPGAVSGHVHTIMGGNGFGFSMDYNDTQESTCSTCMVNKDFSNYWVPTLYYKAQNGSFISVSQTGGATVYYLQRSDEKDPEYDQGLLAFPEGFRMVAGNPTLRNDTGTIESQAISFACLRDEPMAETHHLPNVTCPNGLRAQVFFPSCWNGKDLDSPDHKSHMSYPSIYNAGYCPPEFPKRFISIFYEVMWNVDAFSDMWYDGVDQPFVFSMGDDTGYGYHGDFVNGWDVDFLQDAVTNCNDDSGDITKCSTFSQNFYTDIEMNGCAIPVSVDEQTQGTLEALPGCNPIQYGPAPAVSQQCPDVVSTIGQPEYNYVDLTASKGWEYLGCGFDFAGQSRTLTGSEQDSNNMTVENCVDYCSSKGYSIAGLEYKTQCFCGNSFDPSRAPADGFYGSCNMPCSGDASETCGGYAVISLYQKCNDTCQNIQYVFNNGTGSSGATSSAAPASSSTAASSKSSVVLSSSVAPSSSATPSASSSAAKTTASPSASSSGLPAKAVSHSADNCASASVSTVTVALSTVTVTATTSDVPSDATPAVSARREHVHGRAHV